MSRNKLYVKKIKTLEPKIVAKLFIHETISRIPNIVLGNFISSTELWLNRIFKTGFLSLVLEDLLILINWLIVTVDINYMLKKIKHSSPTSLQNYFSMK